MSSTQSREQVRVGSLGASVLVTAEESESGVAVVEHTLPPHTLGGPLHRHANEDEISFVLEGQLTIQEGENTWHVRPGESVVKRRDEWHTVWNAGDEPVRFLEVVAPGGFADYFAEAAALLPASGRLDEATPADLAAVQDRYGIEMRLDSVAELTSKYGLAR